MYVKRHIESGDAMGGLRRAVARRRLDAGAGTGVTRAPRPRPRARTRDAATAADGGRQGTLEIYGFGQADAIADFKQNDPKWYDVNRPSQAAVVRQAVRRGRPLLPERAAEPLRREGRDPDRQRPREGAVRVRHVRRRRRRRADDDPPAPRVGPVEADRRRPDQQPVHGRRRVPEHPRLLGPERDAVLPQRAGVLRSSRTTTSRSATVAIEAPGASGDARRLRRPRRAAEHQAAVPDAGLHRPLPHGRARRATSRSAASSARSATTTRCPTTRSI